MGDTAESQGQDEEGRPDQGHADDSPGEGILREHPDNVDGDVNTQLTELAEMMENALPSRPPYKFEWYTEQDGTTNGVIRRHDGVIVAEQVLASNGELVAAALNALPAFYDVIEKAGELLDDLESEDAQDALSVVLSRFDTAAVPWNEVKAKAGLS